MIKRDSGQTWIEFGPSQALAVECANGGAGDNPAGNDDDEDTNTACGHGAEALGNTGHRTAIGEDSSATGYGSTAVGSDANNDNVGTTATGEGSSAYGSEAFAPDDQTVAVGFRAVAGSDDGTDAGFGAIAIGGNDDNDLDNNGAEARASGSIAVGMESLVDTDADNGIAIGSYASVAGSGDIAIGPGATVMSDNSTTMGMDSTIGAGSEFSATYGANTSVAPAAPGAVAFGTDSTGAGAAATLPNQYVMGTANHTYTTPGITSATSKQRQSGPLEVVTSDSSGNLATDGGHIFNQLDQHSRQIDRQRHVASLQGDRIERNQTGVAIALSAVGPDLVTNERFGFSLNWGVFEAANAIGGGATAVVYRGATNRLAITGGIGVGLDDDDAVGGRVGGQWTF